MKAIHIDGQVATVQFVSTGTINGEKFSKPICSILTVENGLIVNDDTYHDLEITH